ncbi:MAG: ferritin family protein [Coriobacteriia bacterium]
MTEGTPRDTAGPERLLRLERMMTDAYDAALGKVNDQQLVETLAAFRQHHQMNADALHELARQEGAAPPRLDAQFRRYLAEVLETIEESVRRDESIGELRIAQAALGMVYGQVLSQTTDEQAARTIERCLKQESEHLGVLAMVHETAKP